MAATPSDGAAVVQWLTGNTRDLVWLVALVLGFAGWMSKRRRAAGTPARGAGSRSGLLETLRLAASAPPVPGAGGPRGSRAEPAPRAAAHARVTAPPPEPVLAHRAPTDDEPDRRLRSSLLDAFRDPAGARTAVILAEILAPPVGLR